MTGPWRRDGDRPGFLLIESQGLLAPPEAGFRRDAVAQARSGAEVLLFLIQDGVTLALPGTDAAVDHFQEAGGLLAADRFSLGQRGFGDDRLRSDVQVVEMDDVAGWILDPAVRVVWH